MPAVGGLTDGLEIRPTPRPARPEVPADPDAGLLVGGPGGTPAKPAQGPTIIVAGEEEARIAMLASTDRERSRRVRWPRLQTNRRNWNTAFHMIQDWSQKIEGQSKIVFPDLPMSIHQAAATIENQLVNFQNWFSITSLGGLTVFDPDSLRIVVQHCLDRIWQPGNQVETACKFPSFLAMSIVLGILESEITWKVFGVDSERVTYQLESTTDTEETQPGELLDLTYEYDQEQGPARSYERLTQTISKAFIRTFRLGIDLIPFEDSYPDPSPLNRFHIHEVTRHYSELKNNPDYDPAALERVSRKVTALEAERDKAIRAGVPTGRLLSDDPNQVRVMEYWGDLADPSTGKIKYTNCLLTVCNGVLLRPPTPNPFWHQYRPIITAPLLRTPLSPIHKALVDHAVPVAEAENELGSLMIDGGIAAVWGTRQARPEYLADPTSISKGIPPSFTAVLKKGAPANVKFLERVDEGTTVPDYGMAVLQRLGNARETGMAVPSYRNAQVPPRQALATEAVLASDSSDNLFENISGHVEQDLLEPALQLIWLTIWQGLDDFSQPELVQLLGPERCALLESLTAEERFYLFSNNVKFEVRGLRNLSQNINDFRKISTVATTVSGNPMLQAAFIQRFDPARMIDTIVRAVNVDPTKWEWRSSDAAAKAELMAMLQGGAGMKQSASPFAPPGMTPAIGESPVEGEMAPPNPMGMRGTQV